MRVHLKRQLSQWGLQIVWAKTQASLRDGLGRCKCLALAQYAQIQTQGEFTECQLSWGPLNDGSVLKEIWLSLSPPLSPVYCWVWEIWFHTHCCHELVCSSSFSPQPPPKNLSFLSCHSLPPASADPSPHKLKVSPLGLLRLVLSVFLSRPQGDCGYCAGLWMTLMFLHQPW